MFDRLLLVLPLCGHMLFRSLLECVSDCELVSCLFFDVFSSSSCCCGTTTKKGVISAHFADQWPAKTYLIAIGRRLQRLIFDVMHVVCFGVIVQRQPIRLLRSAQAPLLIRVNGRLLIVVVFVDVLWLLGAQELSAQRRLLQHQVGILQVHR